MKQVRMIDYDDLPEGEKEYQSDNGCGKEYARYLVFEIGGKTVYRSDAMEPEDARFYRNLSWIQHDLDALIAERNAARDEALMLEMVADALKNDLGTARAEAAELREEIEMLREGWAAAIAQDLQAELSAANAYVIRANAETIRLVDELANARAEAAALRTAATEFANTMSRLSPVWNIPMRQAWDKLFATIDATLTE